MTIALRKYLLEYTVFFTGAIVMVFEIVGSRVLGPYFGTSLFVWTSLIGIILGSLALGYYYGGRIADNKPSIKYLAHIIFVAAVAVGFTVFLKDFLLQYLQTSPLDVRSATVIASIILFAPASILLGMVSPYTVRLRMIHVENAGVTVGNLYAISTVGSICGTFLAGFYLVPLFGTNKLLIILSIFLTLISVTLFFSGKKRLQGLIIILLFGGMSLAFMDYAIARRGFVDVDTAYNRVWIYDHKDLWSDRMVRRMGINNENHSSMYVDSDEIYTEYVKYYDLAQYFNPGFERALMLGGAGYSYPKHFLATYPQASIDVVEIDPALTELAKKYFSLKEDPRLAIYHADARAYLNTTEKKYDVIFGDAFSSYYSIPYQLTTREAIQKMHSALDDDGIVIVNLISSLEGDRGQFLRAEYATFRSVFPHVYLFPVHYPDDGDAVQNVMLVALKFKKSYGFESSDLALNEYLQGRWEKEIQNDMPLLTDDFAPVDYYISTMFNDADLELDEYHNVNVHKQLSS